MKFLALTLLLITPYIVNAQQATAVTSKVQLVRELGALGCRFYASEKNGPIPFNQYGRVDFKFRLDTDTDWRKFAVFKLDIK